MKKLAAKTNFTTLDGIEREISSEDLMICDAAQALCIAGVFGGLTSGVSASTTNIFIESAYFNSVSVRKSSKRHGLKTDASFRFERGTDPNITVFALKRVALLILEIAGGEIASELIDCYPTKIEDFKVEFNFQNCDRLIGKAIGKERIKNIISALDIKITHETDEGVSLSVPPYKVDVQREVDVIEEILRIYGYNQIEIPSRVNSSISFALKPDREKIQNNSADFLSANGFAEIMSLSLSPSALTDKSLTFSKENNVAMLNPLSSDLDVLRQTLLFSGLDAIVYNQNRKRSDLKFYEFGKSYQLQTKQETGEKFYSEKNHLALFISGKNKSESWTEKPSQVTFFSLKSAVMSILEKQGITSVKETFLSNEVFSSGLSIEVKQKKLLEFGNVSKAILKNHGIKAEVFYADFDWDAIVKLAGNNKVTFTELPKFPEVRRDLALVVAKEITYAQIQDLAFQTERKLLKEVNLFDVYEGDKLEVGKKSYSVSFLLQDENATLTDKQIEKTMERLMQNYQEKLGSIIRQ